MNVSFGHSSVIRTDDSGRREDKKQFGFHIRALHVRARVLSFFLFRIKEWILHYQIGLEKKNSRLVSRLGLAAARLGLERLASLERAEPSLFSRLAKIPSRADPARSGSRAELPMDHLSIVM